MYRYTYHIHSFDILTMRNAKYVFNINKSKHTFIVLSFNLILTQDLKIILRSHHHFKNIITMLMMQISFTHSPSQNENGEAIIKQLFDFFLLLCTHNALRMI